MFYAFPPLATVLAPRAEPGEEWRRCLSWPSLWASSTGRIASQGPRYEKTPRILKTSRDADGYARIPKAEKLQRGWMAKRAPANGQFGFDFGEAVAVPVLKSYRPHRVGELVLDAFHGPRPEGLEMLHRSGDPTDDRPENLRWDTSRENKLDTLRHRRHRRAVVDDDAVLQILLALYDGELLKTTAEWFGISVQAVCDIQSGRRWSHVHRLFPRRAAWKEHLARRAEEQRRRATVDACGRLTPFTATPQRQRRRRAKLSTSSSRTDH